MDTVGLGKENNNTNSNLSTSTIQDNTVRNLKEAVGNTSKTGNQGIERENKHNSDNNRTNKQEINLLEWRFNQFLGEKIAEPELKEQENQSYVITEMQMNDRGEFLLLGDKGGRIIIFQKKFSKKNRAIPKLRYFHEFSAYEKDFDVHKSVEYSEQLRSIAVLPSLNNDKINILSAGYRTIKLHSVFNYKTKFFSNDSKSFDKIEKNSDDYLEVPKLRVIKPELRSRCKKVINMENSSEIHSLSYNKIFNNQFISSDHSKVLLWDINNTKGEIFSVINFSNDEEVDMNPEDNQEKITKTKFCDSDPHIIGMGTNQGKIKLCDTRTSSDCLQTSTTFLDEFQNITNYGFNLTRTLFAWQIMAVHDLNFQLCNENYFASRHFLSVNLWDKRNNKQPLNKFLVYEPTISKLSHIYIKNYMMTDKFSLSASRNGKYILTGGYNNMFHVFDIEQKLNTQITINSNDTKMMNTNIIRKINSKGSCFYKKDDPSLSNLDFDSKILKHCYSPIDNYIIMSIQNCIYAYTGTLTSKRN